MINIKLVRRSGLDEKGLTRICEREDSDTPQILVFPELTFKNKFTLEEISRLSGELPLGDKMHAFFSAYVLQTEEEARQNYAEYAKQIGSTYQWDNGSIMRALFGPKYVNTGFVVSNNGSQNSIQSYRKHISTKFDSLNEDLDREKVATYSFIGDSVSGVAYDEIDFKKTQIKFPVLNVEGQTIEFRVCADIECGTQNTPNVILVAAHNLYKVQNRANIIHEIPLIVNDSGSMLFPIGYREGKKYRTTRELSRVCEKEGIIISKIR